MQPKKCERKYAMILKHSVIARALTGVKALQRKKDRLKMNAATDYSALRISEQWSQSSLLETETTNPERTHIQEKRGFPRSKTERRDNWEVGFTFLECLMIRDANAIDLLPPSEVLRGRLARFGLHSGARSWILLVCISIDRCRRSPTCLLPRCLVAT